MVKFNEVNISDNRGGKLIIRFFKKLKNWLSLKNFKSLKNL